MTKYTLLCTILCLILISTPHITNPVHSATANDGSSKRKAIPAQLGKNSGSLEFEQQQVWYSFDSTANVGYQLQLNRSEYVSMGIQILDQNHTTLYKHSLDNKTVVGGFIGRGLVYIILYDFVGSGTYTFSIKEREQGQDDFNPFAIRLGSTSVTINSSQQKLIYFHYNSRATDYLSFNLNFDTPGVTIKATLQNSNDPSGYHTFGYPSENLTTKYTKNYNTTSQENLEVPVVYDGLNILLLITTDVDVFDLTIHLNRALGPAGQAPSNAIPMSLDEPQSIIDLNNLGQQFEYFNISMPSDGWYMMNVTVSYAAVYEVTIYNENNEVVMNYDHYVTTISFFQVVAGDYIVKVTQPVISNMTLTLSQRDPAPGYDLSHAVVVDNSGPVTFTSVNRYVHMNLTLDPSKFHLLTINIENESIPSSHGAEIIIPDQVSRYASINNNPIFLPNGQRKISVMIFGGKTPHEITFSVSLTDIDKVSFGNQVSAIPIKIGGTTVKANYSGQDTWVKFFAEKGVRYTFQSDNVQPVFYREDGLSLGYANEFVGSNAEVYACFTPTDAISYVFTLQKEAIDTNTQTSYYSQNFHAGDYLEYTDSHTFNGEKQNIFPYSVDHFRVNIFRDNIVINENEFLRMYIGYDFGDTTAEEMYHSDYNIVNLLLLPVHSSKGMSGLDRREILQQEIPRYDITEDTEYYYLSNSVISTFDFSNTTITYVYDKTNLNLISYTSQHFWTNGWIENYNITLVNSKITGHGSGFETTITTKSNGDAPVKTPLPIEGFVTSLIILPILVKKSRQKYH